MADFHVFQQYHIFRLVVVFISPFNNLTVRWVDAQTNIASLIALICSQPTVVSMKNISIMQCSRWSKTKGQHNLRSKLDNFKMIQRSGVNIKTMQTEKRTVMPAQRRLIMVRRHSIKTWKINIGLLTILKSFERLGIYTVRDPKQIQNTQIEIWPNVGTYDITKKFLGWCCFLNANN